MEVAYTVRPLALSRASVHIVMFFNRQFATLDSLYYLLVDSRVLGVINAQDMLSSHQISKHV